MPMTLMCVDGLKMGLSLDDLRRMPFGRLANMILASNRRSNRGGGDAGFRQATQSDIDMLAR